MILGIGTDIVEISRIEQVLQRHGERFARRILSETEQQEFAAHAMPATFLAKRFAVKEAAAKALGTGIARGISWQHITLGHDRAGAPRLQFGGQAAVLQQQRNINGLHVSLADERDYVVAFVVLEQ